MSLINRYLPLILVTLLTAGCGGGQDSTHDTSGNSASGPPAASAPDSPSYGSEVLSLTVGRAIALFPFPAENGISYSVTPSLPAGLTLDGTSGEIAGTPLASSPAVNFTITARSDSDSGTAPSSISLEVVEAPLFYPDPVLATVGTPLTPVHPSGGGTIQSFAVEPDLPQGMSLDPVTGVLSGTPLQASDTTYYKITGKGPLVSRMYGLLFGVSGETGSTATGVFRDSTVSGLGYRSGAHAGVTDTNGRFTYEVGQSVSFYVGAVTLGTVATAKSLVTPVDLIPGGTASSTYVSNAARFLLMLDQDGDPNNGVQISPAVTADAASWAAVDFTTSDLATVLSSHISRARAADGGAHALPDAVSAQAHLAAAVNCAYSGGFVGSLAADSEHPDNDLVSIAFTPDGHARARIVKLPTGDTRTSTGTNGLSAALDGSFTASFGVPATANIQGTFAGPDFLMGTYDDGTTSRPFRAARIAGVSTAQYRYSGGYLPAGMEGNYPSGFAVLDVDAANNVSGFAFGSTDGALYGDTTDQYGERDGFLLALNTQLPLSGTIPGIASTSGASTPITMTLGREQFGGTETSDSSSLQLNFGDIYDGPYFSVRGCRLN